MLDARRIHVHDVQVKKLAQIAHRKKVPSGQTIISDEEPVDFFANVISGAIKLVTLEWRDGSALIYFLDGGLHGPLSTDSPYRHRPVAMACSWAFIVWECLFPFALAGPRIAAVFCAVAALFHFLVFRYFGLNRFFWAWLASFPAIIWCSAQW